MNGTQLRGFATASYWATDLQAAIDWYTEVFGVEPYFVRPLAPERPQYVEFRVGDYEDELGLIDATFNPAGPSAAPSGTVLYWHVDDVDAAMSRLIGLGATEYQPIVKRDSGFITASVVDPFGNIIGLMYNPHYLEILEKR